MKKVYKVQAIKVKWIFRSKKYLKIGRKCLVINLLFEI